MGDYFNEAPGDNIEFTAVAIGDYTIYQAHNDNTSANDTEFTKYPDNSITARKFEIRTNQNANLISLNHIEFTNPAKITKNKAYIESRNVPVITKMVIRTTVANTEVKIRWF